MMRFLEKTVDWWYHKPSLYEHLLGGKYVVPIRQFSGFSHFDYFVSSFCFHFYTGTWKIAKTTANLLGTFFI